MSQACENDPRAPRIRQFTIPPTLSIAGGVYASFDATVNIDGNTSFYGNFAEDYGGKQLLQ